jgi:hypothetical protein
MCYYYRRLIAYGVFANIKALFNKLFGITTKAADKPKLAQYLQMDVRTASSAGVK